MERIMRYVGQITLICVGSMLAASSAVAQDCDPGQRESGGYIILNAGERDNAKAKCVVGGTRCETQFAKDTNSFTLVQVAGEPGKTQSEFRRTDGTLRWKAELFASNSVDASKKFVLTADATPKEVQEFSGSQIVKIDEKKYRVILSDKMEAALEKAKNVSWAFTEGSRVTTLTFSLSGSERTLKWIKCTQAKPQYLTSCETTSVRTDWIARHRAVSDANGVLSALNSQITVYPDEDFGYDENTRRELKKEAVALFKSAREAYDNFFGRVAARTTRACSICDLKALYDRATQGGLGESITQNQLNELVSKNKLVDLQLLANSNSSLQIMQKKLDSTPITDSTFAALSAQVDGLKRDVARLKDALKLTPAPQSPQNPPEDQPFKVVLAGFQCDIR